MLKRGQVVPVATIRAVARPAREPDGAIVAMFPVFRGF